MLSTARVVTVGSGPDAQLRLDDPYVAPRHAILHAQGGRLYISDNQTAQGILVNGQRVPSAEVTAFDEIQIGECRLKFEPVAGAPAAATGAAAPALAPNAELLRPGAPPPPEKPRFVGGPMSPSQQVQATSLVPRAQNKRRSHPPSAPDSLDHDLFGDLGQAMPPPPPPLSDIVHADQLPSLEGLEPATEVASAHALGLDFPPTSPPGGAIHDSHTAEDLAPVEVRSSRSGPSRRSREPRPAADPSELDLPAASPSHGLDGPGVGVGMPVEGELLPSYDDGELSDEEREELDFAQPFSLLENVIRERFQTPVQSEPEPVVEVISYREGRLFDVTRIERGHTFEVLEQGDNKPVPLLQLRKNGRARLLFRTSTKGSVVVGGQTTTLATLCTPENLENKRRELYRAELAEGDFAHIKLDGRGYLLRFVRSPKPPPRKLDASVTSEDRRHVLVALGVMLLVFAGFWLVALLSPPPLEAAPDDVEFAEVTLKDLELEKPEEPPPPEPEPEPEPPAETEAPPPPPEPEKKKTKQKPEKRVRQRDVAPPPDPSQEAAKEALAALSTLKPTQDSKLSAKVTNIAAVRVPDGASKRFKVAGEISKLGGSDVILSTSGSGGKTTRSAAKLLEGRNIGAIAQRGSTGPVRGRVSRLPPRSISQEGGSLSRDAILKVVMAGLGDVQRCYERALMSTPGLQGKVVFDWVIAPSGRVQSTRVRSSTMSSQAVTTCISGVIKGWQFPQPQGGSVKVTYPFIFKASSF